MLLGPGSEEQPSPGLDQQAVTRIPHTDGLPLAVLGRGTGKGWAEEPRCTEKPKIKVRCDCSSSSNAQCSSFTPFLGSTLLSSSGALQKAKYRQAGVCDQPQICRVQANPAQAGEPAAAQGLLREARHRNRHKSPGYGNFSEQKLGSSTRAEHCSSKTSPGLELGPGPVLVALSSCPGLASRDDFVLSDVAANYEPSKCH